MVKVLHWLFWFNYMLSGGQTKGNPSTWFISSFKKKSAIVNTLLNLWQPHNQSTPAADAKKNKNRKQHV